MTGNNKIRVIYDPYQQEIRCEYMSAAGNTWEAPQAGGKLAAMFSNGERQGSLQNCAHDIVEGIKHDFCTTGQGVDLFFCGTEEDWVDLKKVVEQDTGSKIICVGSAGQLECAKDVLPKIKEIFQHLSNDFEGLTENDEVKKPIDQFLTTIKPDVVLYVSGTYSAGKSTFINALIGEELLPSAIDPTTAHIFRIESLPEGNWVNTKIHFQYLNKDVVITFGKDGYVLEDPNLLPDLELKHCLDRILEGVTPGPVYIKTVLELINSFNSLKAPESKEQERRKWISPQIEVSTPFYNSTLPLNDFRFLIYDTPGTNAANHRDHLAVMQDALKEQTNGLPILLVTPTQTDATEVEELRNEIHKIGGALDESNILVVVTQADKETFASLKRSHQNQKAAAFENAENRICYTSAAMGFYSKTGRYPTMGIESEEDQEENLEKLESNSTPYKNGRTRLYTIDSLPHNQMETICEKGNLANETGTEKEKMLHNSGLWAIEREIERFARRFAGYNKCWQAKGYLSEAIESVTHAQESEKKTLSVLNKRNIQNFKKHKEMLIEQIETSCTSWQNENFKTCKNEQQKIIDSFSGITPDLVKEKWDLFRHNKYIEQDPLSKLQKWASSAVKSKILVRKKRIETFANQFWSEEIRKLKMSCIQIVINSPVLTEEEKAFAKKFILSLSPIKFVQVNYVLPPRAAEKRGFLIFKWNYINPVACARDMTETVDEALFGFLNDYDDDLREDIQKWTTWFRESLIKELDKFNPTLKELTEKIQACANKIYLLGEAQKRLKSALQSLNNFFILDDGNGGTT